MKTYKMDDKNKKQVENLDNLLNDFWEQGFVVRGIVYQKYKKGINPELLIIPVTKNTSRLKVGEIGD